MGVFDIYIFFNHQTKKIIFLKKKKPIGFWCRGINPQVFFILPLKILLVELIGTHILLVLHCSRLCIGD